MVTTGATESSAIANYLLAAVRDPPTKVSVMCACVKLPHPKQKLMTHNDYICTLLQPPSIHSPKLIMSRNDSHIQSNVSIYLSNSLMHN